ncbi:MAG: hypothetical protein MUF58_08570 [Arcicella sp.]|jgi:hypothetical protein|nr:hypothetical protein [Arcicella sp.]
MKNLKFGFIILCLVIGLYQIPNLLAWVLGHNRFSHIQVNQLLIERIFDAFGIFVVILFLLAVTYKKIWGGDTFKKILPALGFAVVIIGLFFLIKELYSNFRAVDRLYVYYKKNIGIVGDVFTADDSLGHRGIPNSTGKSVFPLDKNTQIVVPIKLNEEGFRIPENAPVVNSDTLMMFLGCSFTWGDYSLAEDNYSSQAVKLLKYKPLNCGINAYGLAQMLILAQRQIPKHKPKVVCVQYSPWLADRARFIFFPSAHGVMPFPFVTQNDKNELYIHEPYFRSALYNPDYKYYKTSPESFSDKLSFFFNVGVPVAIVDSWKQRFIQWKMTFGIAPTSESDNQKIEKFVYEKIYQLCKAHNARMMVLNVGGFGYSDEQRMSNHYDRKRFQETMSSDLLQNITFIDADSVLRAGIKPKENYSKYVQWGKINKVDSIIYDNHPNPMTHKIIAETLVKGMKQ